jgi:integrase
MSKTPRRDGSIVEYPCKDGSTTFRARFYDGNGERQIETLGNTRDGLTRKQAEKMLADRLSDVRRNAYTSPARTTFGTVAHEWRDSISSRQLKRSTRDSYVSIIDGHLIPAFGSVALAKVDVPKIESVKAGWMEAGAEPGTVNRRLNVLGQIFKSCVKRKLIAENPVHYVDRPRERKRSWPILTPKEVGRVVQAFDQLIAGAEGDALDDLITARAMFVVLIDSGIRRGEMLGLRWRHVSLADPDGPTIEVSETWTRNQIDTPKSNESRRNIAISGYCAEVLTEHLGRARFDGDDDRVFANPRRGSAFDVHTYKLLFEKALAKADISDRDRIRPFHDMRHGALTNAAASGMSPVSLQARAGHSSFQTTGRYIALAGVQQREEAARAGARMWGARTLRVVRVRSDDAEQPPTLVVEDMPE